MNKYVCIAELLDVMGQAIDDGDWKINGLCDPRYAMDQAEIILRENGWTKNGIDGHWQKAP
jgi:hypothetical protein